MRALWPPLPRGRGVAALAHPPTTRIGGLGAVAVFIESKTVNAVFIIFTAANYKH
jgi:hypothetical protein